MTNAPSGPLLRVTLRAPKIGVRDREGPTAVPPLRPRRASRSVPYRRLCDAEALGSQARRSPWRARPPTRSGRPFGPCSPSSRSRPIDGSGARQRARSSGWRPDESAKDLGSAGTSATNAHSSYQLPRNRRRRRLAARLFVPCQGHPRASATVADADGTGQQKAPDRNPGPDLPFNWWRGTECRILPKGDSLSRRLRGLR